MRRTIQNRIFALLDATKASDPELLAEAQEVLRRSNIEASFRLDIRPPTAATSLPTFDRTVSRQFTPMLEARFEYAGSWRRGPEVWLDPLEMATFMNRKEVIEYHQALRSHFEGSAPMCFPDSALTLFATTDEPSQDLTYLVWGSEQREPELWEYSDYDFRRSPNLEEYLVARLDRVERK